MIMGFCQKHKYFTAAADIRRVEWARRSVFVNKPGLTLKIQVNILIYIQYVIFRFILDRNHKFFMTM